jgi:hypothetical protein
MNGKDKDFYDTPDRIQQEDILVRDQEYMDYLVIRRIEQGNATAADALYIKQRLGIK